MTKREIRYMLWQLEMTERDVKKAVKKLDKRLTRAKRGDSMSISGSYDYHPVKLVKVIDKEKGIIEVNEPGNSTVTQRVTKQSIVDDIRFDEEITSGFF